MARITILALILLANCNLFAQTVWDKDPGNPVLANGDPGEWDEARAYFGWVIKENGIYKMWYTGYNNSTTSGIGYATSTDGILWDKHSDNPIITPDQSWEGTDIFFPTVIKVGGTYRMWYTSGIAVNAIGYATSTDGISWVKHSSNPVLSQGPGSWDNNGVLVGTVTLEAGTYKMWYTGAGPPPAIGYATSTDGITWSEHSGPAP